MDYQTLLVEQHNGIVTLTINRPDKLNALSEVVLSELKDLLTGLAAKSFPEIRGMLVTGAGDKAFIAGADIARMSEMSPAEGATFGRLGQSIPLLLEALPFPVIACVHGYALGGGCEIAMGCDYIFATEAAVFGQPEVSLGLIPGFGGCVRLLRFVGPGRAKELIYTGRNVKADEALRIGLANRVFATKQEMLAGAAESLALVAAKSPVAISVCKQILNELEGKTTKDQLRVENDGFFRAFESEDMREGTKAFLGKRKPAFTGK
jgi:enoyl-CoA hydratase